MRKTTRPERIPVIGARKAEHFIVLYIFARGWQNKLDDGSLKPNARGLVEPDTFRGLNALLVSIAKFLAREPGSPLDLALPADSPATIKTLCAALDQALDHLLDFQRRYSHGDITIAPPYWHHPPQRRPLGQKPMPLIPPS